jgi:periplasmic protein TonB
MKPEQASKHIWQAFGTALGMELTLLAAALVWVQTHPPAGLQQFVPLVFDVMEPSETKAPAPMESPAPQVVSQTPPPVLPRQEQSRSESQIIATEQPAAAPELAQEPLAAHSTNNQPSAFATPAPAAHAAPAGPVVDPAIAYNVKLAAAVQAAFEIPAAVSALGFKGRTQVEFVLRDGRVSAIKVLQGSGLGAADRAAIKAVQAAVYPSPPAALQGHEGRYQIWVVCF